MRVIAQKQTTTTSDIVTTSNGSAINVERAKVIGLQAVVDVNVPAAKTFVDGDVNTSTDRITITGHAFVTTGLKVAATTTGVLPGGLSATDYWVIVVDANTIKLASSLANAQAGTNVDITSAAGGGTHTLTPASIAGATLTLQKSNNYNPDTAAGDWDAVEAATAITADGDIWIADVDPEYNWVRISYTLTAGKLSASTVLIVKEDV